MQYQYILYIWPLAASAFASLSLGIFAVVRRRNVKGAKSFIASMLIVTIWSGANALEMSGADLPTKLFWANMQYFAYCYSPVTLLALCMQFTGFDHWVRSKKILWAAVIPTVTILLVWTDGLHGLMRYDIHLDYSGIFPVIAKKYGSFFFFHAAYSHLLNITALVLLIRMAFFKKMIYMKQAIALLIGTSMIVVPNVMYVLGFSPIGRFDITPVFFGPAGLITAFGIFRLKMFDIVALARTTIIETMNAGVMVLDLQDRVLDINPAFEKILDLSASKICAVKVDEVCSKIPELSSVCVCREQSHVEFSAETEGSTGIFEAFISPLADSKGIHLGRLVVAYEITEKKRAQQEFLRQQKKIAAAEERERMARDLHDNLGQVLGFINLQAQAVRKELMNEGVNTVSNKLDRLVDVTRSAHNEVREYIKNVRNTEHKEMSFVDELKKDISGFSEDTGINVKLNIPDIFCEQELIPNIWMNILSILKEALNNVRKHAEADNVSISVLLSQQVLHVEVEDDGKGFDPVLVSNGAGNTYGLSIMRERAYEIGAQLDIESSAGKGSRIRLCVPAKGGETESEVKSDVG